MAYSRLTGKEDKVQFIDGQLTLLFSSAARIFHTTANVTSRKCDSGYKFSKNLFWNIFIISMHGLVYFYQNTKQTFVEFPETKGAIIGGPLRKSLPRKK